MSYTKPSYSDIYNTVKQDLFARFPTLDPTLRSSMAESIVSVIAAGINGNYNYIEYTGNQLFPDTASADSVDKWGSVVGLYRLPASKASGSVSFSGLSGSIVPTGSELSNIAGNLFEVETGFEMVGPAAYHTVVAKDYGTDGNLSAGDVLTFTTTYTGMNSDATVSPIDFTGGLDRETDEEYRTRILERFQSPPKGGSENDYIAWVKEAIGATRVWIRSWENAADFGETIQLGYVKAYFAIDDVYTYGIPVAGDVTTTDAYVNPLKPIGSVFNSAAPVGYAVDVSVQITPYSTELATEVEDALDEVIRAYGSPGGTILYANFLSAISSITGITNYNVTTPISSVTATAGYLHIPGTYTITAI